MREKGRGVKGRPRARVSAASDLGWRKGLASGELPMRDGRPLTNAQALSIGEEAKGVRRIEKK